MNKTDEKLYYLNEMLMDFVNQEGFGEDDILKSELVIELRNIIVIEFLKVKGTEVVGSGLLKDIIRKAAEFHVLKVEQFLNKM